MILYRFLLCDHAYFTRYMIKDNYNNKAIG